MGCGVSRLGSGNGLSFPAKLRPLVFLQDTKIHKSKLPLKISDSTPSKKLLLLHDVEKGDIIEDHDNSFSSCKTPSKSYHSADVEESSRGERQNGGVNEGKISNTVDEGFNSEIEDEFIDACSEDHEDDQDEDDGRMIGNDDVGFMGSPSFRIYCNTSEKEEYFDAGNNHDTFEDSVSSADTHISPEVLKCVVDEKKVEKRGKSKKNSLRKVLPKVFMSCRYRNKKSTQGEEHQNSQ